MWAEWEWCLLLLFCCFITRIVILCALMKLKWCMVTANTSLFDHSNTLMKCKLSNRGESIDSRARLGSV